MYNVYAVWNIFHCGYLRLTNAFAANNHLFCLFRLGGKPNFQFSLIIMTFFLNFVSGIVQTYTHTPNSGWISTIIFTYRPTLKTTIDAESAFNLNISFFNRIVVVVHFGFCHNKRIYGETIVIAIAIGVRGWQCRLQLYCCSFEHTSNTHS